ncbi:MAG: hypothetical protein ACSHXB_07835 [Sulfitobacter sp.]
MEMIADILLVAGALGAAFYCFILGRRLNRFNDLEKGVGGAVAILSSQVDDLTKTLTAAQRSAGHSAETLSDLSQRAEETSRRLELQMASLHDLQPVSSEAHPKNQCEEPRPPQPSEPMFVRHRASGTAS